jgi:hypothetical protein
VNEKQKTILLARQLMSNMLDELAPDIREFIELTRRPEPQPDPDADAMRAVLAEARQKRGQ